VIDMALHPDFATLAARRRTIRGFLPDPAPRAVVEDLLTQARTAPSGANLQPGRFIALTDAPLAALVDELMTAIAQNRPQVAEYGYFPEPMPPHLKARQRAAGYALYTALGIARRDLDGRRAQFRHNYRFFDAPVGIVVIIDRAMGPGCYMDLGMAIQTFMLAATARGYATCPIGALASHGDVVHEHLGLPGGELVVCGLALGREDPNAPANRSRTDRAPLDEFAEFRGFGP
jgi:nitroreductase